MKELLLNNLVLNAKESTTFSMKTGPDFVDMAKFVQYLRNKKEFVNHKILDLVGDFLLSGYRVLGKVKCYQGGHELTNMFLRKMLDSKFTSINLKTEKLELAKSFNQAASTKLAVNA